MNTKRWHGFVEVHHCIPITQAKNGTWNDRSHVDCVNFDTNATRYDIVSKLLNMNTTQMHPMSLSCQFQLCYQAVFTIVILPLIPLTGSSGVCIFLALARILRVLTFPLSTDQWSLFIFCLAPKQCLCERAAHVPLKATQAYTPPSSFPHHTHIL